MEEVIQSTTGLTLQGAEAFTKKTKAQADGIKVKTLDTTGAGNQQENEKVLISHAHELATEDKNKTALKELNSLGKFPYTKDNFGRRISLSRKCTTYYGGLYYLLSGL